MKIDENLNIVLNVRSDEDGKPLLQAFHTPISRAVFEANWRILSATRAALFSKGSAFAYLSGPRIASLLLADEGKKDAVDRGDVDDDGNPGDGGATAFLSEIKRLTMILVPGPNGWDFMPVDHAIAGNVIEPEEWQETCSELVFFSCGYCLAKKNERKTIAQALVSALTGSVTSSILSEYCVFSPKSTADAPSIPAISPKAASLVPQ